MCILHNACGTSLICTVVYAHNVVELRISLWQCIISQANLFNFRWIILGHLNGTLYSHDRINNGVQSCVGDIDFLNCITATNLIELDLYSFFTWRGGTSFSIHSKSIECLLTPTWITNYLNLVSIFVIINSVITPLFILNFLLIIHSLTDFLLDIIIHGVCIVIIMKLWRIL